MDTLLRENNYIEDWAALVVAAFLLLGLGIMLGMYIEKSLKKLFVLKRQQTLPSSNSTLLVSNKSTANSEEERLLPPIDRDKVPKHIAVIMDGNRRFGKLTHSDPLQGHWAGGQTLVDFIQWCIQDGVQMATVYAFSTENWNRDPIEVTTLMTIFAKYAETFVTEALSNDVRVNVFSTDFEKLPPKVQASVRELQEKTKACATFTLNICLSYGGRRDILFACRNIAEQLLQNRLTVTEIDEDVFNRALVTQGIPEPEVLIRTSGEFRLSNFLLWQTAYSELFFIEKFWPQFNQRDLRRILHEYVQRGRRFGK